MVARKRCLVTSSGFYLGATLLDHVKTNMRVYQEEIFGPVLAIVRVPDLGGCVKA